MAINPLQQYFRQPKIYISLPSKGVYNPPGTLQGDITNLAVHGMTGMDEIIIKTPDALFSGEASVKVVESCCPSIKDPWSLTVLDTDLVFTAIRIATYGNNISVTHTCPKCSNVSDYELDLNSVVEHFNKCAYDNRLVLKDLVIKIRPLTYKQQTENNLRIYELQKQVMQANELEDKEEQQQIINELWKELAKIQLNVNIDSVDSVETPQTTVTERSYIAEWLTNCDKETVEAINNHIDKNRQQWMIPKFPVECSIAECKAPDTVQIELDTSTFFG